MWRTEPAPPPPPSISGRSIAPRSEGLASGGRGRVTGPHAPRLALCTVAIGAFRRVDRTSHKDPEARHAGRRTRARRAHFRMGGLCSAAGALLNTLRGGPGRQPLALDDRDLPLPGAGSSEGPPLQATAHVAPSVHPPGAGSAPPPQCWRWAPPTPPPLPSPRTPVTSVAWARGQGAPQRAGPSPPRPRGCGLYRPRPLRMQHVVGCCRAVPLPAAPPGGGGAGLEGPGPGKTASAPQVMPRPALNSAAAVPNHPWSSPSPRAPLPPPLTHVHRPRHLHV